MTNEAQYTFYKDFSYKIFNYLNQRINRFIKPVLYVDYSDMVNFTFANIRRPNNVFIHIDNIVIECGNGYNKNKVCSMITTVLTHELFHVEQIMSQEMYRTDRNYKINVENAVDGMSYNFLLMHKEEIDKLFGMNLDLFYYNHNRMNSHYRSFMELYRKGTAAEIYKYTIMNVIFRKDMTYFKFEDQVLNKYKNIYVSFENGHNFLIKSNGIFCDSILNEFISEVGVAAGIYDRYTIKVNVIEPNRDDANTAQVVFMLSNRFIYPMQFGKD